MPLILSIILKIIGMKTLLKYAFGILSLLNAQEFNCNVNVIADQIQLSDKGIFETMKQDIQEFMNSRQWTDETFDVEERIECNIQLTLTEMQNQTSFSGSIQITASRPIYRTNYNSPLLNILDENLAFSYQAGQRFEWVDGQHINNLSSILAFYAYYMLGTDFDSFGKDSGTPYFQTAQNIVNTAVSNSASGWRVDSGKGRNKNRFKLVDNILSKAFEKMRACYYDYHRLGLDLMYDNKASGMQKIIASLKTLEEVNRLSPLSFNLDVFFQAKRNELLAMFKNADLTVKNEIIPVLKRLDPTYISQYDKIAR